MKRFLAFILAVVMMASLSVTAFAGGGDYETTLYGIWEPVATRYFTTDDGYSQIVTYAVSIPNENAENSQEGMVEWSAPKKEFEIDAKEWVKDGVRLYIYQGGETAWIYTGGDLVVTSVTAENGNLKLKKSRDEWGWECYILTSVVPLTEPGTIEETIVVKTPKAMYKEHGNIADKGNGPFTYKLPVAITITGELPAGNTGNTGNSGSASSGAAAREKEAAPPATENKANDTKTLDAIKAGETAEVKLMNGAAGISTGTMDTLGTSSGKLTVTNNKMTVTIPGGFGKVTEAGRIYYLLDCIDNLANAGDLAKPVKGDNAKTEVLKVGGNMQMPTTVTVTLKTKLTGKVNVYYYDDNTGKYTLLASPVAEDGKITFATKQLGHMILTTGTI